MIKKRIISICLIFCIVSLSGCKNNELETLNLSISEEYLKIESVIHAFETSEKYVSEFDNLFDIVFSMSYTDFMDVLLDESNPFNLYFSGNTNYYSNLLSLKGEFESLGLEYSIESSKKYHFLDTKTGNIEELIILKSPNNTYYLSLYWTGGKVQSLELSKGA